MAKRKSQVEADAADQDQVQPETPETETAASDEEPADRDIDGLRKALEPGEVLVQFTMDVVVEDEHQGTARETRYAGGAIEALTEGGAQHFINRGKAVAV